jgi:hypothetical protein
VALVEATQSIHRFAFDVSEDRLDAARQRLAALVDELSAPAASP